MLCLLCFLEEFIFRFTLNELDCVERHIKRPPQIPRLRRDLLRNQRDSRRMQERREVLRHTIRISGRQERPSTRRQHTRYLRRGVRHKRQQHGTQILGFETRQEAVGQVERVGYADDDELGGGRE